MMDSFNKILAPLIIVCGIVAVVVILSQSNTPKHPSYNLPIPYRCDKGHEFSITVQQLSDFQVKHFAQGYPCPVCGSHMTMHANDAEADTPVPLPPIPKSDPAKPATEKPAGDKAAAPATPTVLTPANVPAPAVPAPKTAP